MPLSTSSFTCRNSTRKGLYIEALGVQKNITLSEATYLDANSASAQGSGWIACSNGMSASHLLRFAKV
jgi:hypothetical protein